MTGVAVMSTRRALILAIALTAGAGIAAGPVQAFTLDEVEKDVTADYPTVRHVLPDAVPAAATPGGDVLLIDVREEDEFAVSHLPGALRADPGMDPDEFMRAFGDKVAGKQVLFYCSVGVRSSDMAQRVAAKLATAGAKGVANLSGGIFRWHNERRTLMSSAGRTDLVHPYNRKWGALINRQPQVSYTPVPGQ
jgi:rhodanese-related sulfurtransferase